MELTSRARAFPVLFELADCPRGGSSAQFVVVFFVFVIYFGLIRFCFRFFVAAGLQTVQASVADGPDPTRTVCLVFADGPFFSVCF
jgi:hypothetical protein